MTPLTALPDIPTPSRHPLALLRDPATIRVRCAAVLKSVEDNNSANFRLDRDALAAVADRVAALTLRRFPDLRIPVHSRWRHFEAGGIDRKAELDEALQGRDRAERARVHFDLTVVSVLLDAGAGPRWHYTESKVLDALAMPAQHHGSDDLLALLDRAARPKAAVDAAPAPAAAAEGGAVDAAVDAVVDAHSAVDAVDAVAAGVAVGPQADAPSAPDGPAKRPTYTRSEGLGVASFRAFMAGAFSSHKDDALRCDASALQAVDAAALRGVFQATPSNPMVGLEGRAGLISRLGEALTAEAARDGVPARPGLLFDRITDGGRRSEVSAAEVLGEVLRIFAPIWKSGSLVQGLPAGDVWPHRWAGDETGSGERNPTTGGWVPFHKLSQWLSYSLLEPLEWAGVTVTGLDALTGLPEYRNGGLLLDGAVIVPRNPRDLERTWKASDEFIVEWRALTVVLLDELAVLVRQRLGRTAEQLPLACILEGGTWAAGREIALELRSDGAPPLKIDSDGTIF